MERNRIELNRPSAGSTTGGRTVTSPRGGRIRSRQVLGRPLSVPSGLPPHSKLTDRGINPSAAAKSTCNPNAASSASIVVLASGISSSNITAAEVFIGIPLKSSHQRRIAGGSDPCISSSRYPGGSPSLGQRQERGQPQRNGYHCQHRQIAPNNRTAASASSSYP